MEPTAFYLLVGGGRFESTAATAGPWSAGSQHGGPPSALLARAFDQLEPDPNQRLARLTVEILRPVPVAPLTVTARIVRPGRRVTLLEGSLMVDGAEYLLARGWRIGRPATPTPVSGARAGSPPLPGIAPQPAWEGAFANGYMRAVEVRQTSGVFAGAGPGAAWIRARIPLIEGEEPSLFRRAAIVADAGSGVSQGVDHRQCGADAVGPPRPGRRVDPPRLEHRGGRRRDRPHRHCARRRGRRVRARDPDAAG